MLYVVNFGSVVLIVCGKIFDVGIGYVLLGEVVVFLVKGFNSFDVNGVVILYISVDDWGSSCVYKVIVGW